MAFRDYYNNIAELPKCHTVMEKEWNAISARIAALWKIFSDSLLQNSDDLMTRFSRQYFNKKELVFKNLTLVKNVDDDQLCKEIEENLEKVHKEGAELFLKQEHFKSTLKGAQPQIGEDYIDEDFSDIPLFYEDIVRIPKNSSVSNQFAEGSETKEVVSEEEKPKEGCKLIVLCHGIQGSHSDMLPLAEKIRQYDASNLVLLSDANEHDHQGELYLMGRRLAEEINDHYKLVNSTVPIKSISFVAFSTGKLK